MKNIYCFSQTIKETLVNNREVGLDESLKIFSAYPWAEESIRAEKAEEYHGISFRSGKSRDIYMNLIVLDEKSVSVMLEVVIKPGFMALFFRKADFMYKEHVSFNDAKNYIRDFYKMDSNELYLLIGKRKIE